jgi:hypothetical protein
MKPKRLRISKDLHLQDPHILSFETSFWKFSIMVFGNIQVGYYHMLQLYSLPKQNNCTLNTLAITIT